MQFTPLQHNAIGLHVRDLDTCVVAGPGSGKTTVLIERFRGLVEAGTSPLRILAITFTEKAANQMRDRLGRVFADRPDLLGDVRRAYCSTVHGFCTRLLRENAIHAGVDPRFRVLNEQEAFSLQQKSVADALDAFLADQPEEACDLMRSLYSPDLGESLLEIYGTMRAAGMDIKDLHPPQPASGGREALNHLAGQCRQIASERLFDWKATQREQVDRVIDWGRRLDQRRNEPVTIADFQLLGEFECSLNRLKRNNPVYDLIQNLKERLIKDSEQLLAAEFYAGYRETLLESLGRFDQLYRHRKREAAALDFSDLEEFSVKLLQENDAVRQRVRRQFDYILMDEFQDTNGLQATLLALLRVPDRFYAVGDINQSIYGFRHANPQVFLEYRSKIQEEGKHLAELRENWRSRADVLRAVSSLVGDTEGVERHAFQPVRPFASKHAPSVEVISCLAADNDVAQLLEAKWVARRIRELQGTLHLEKGPARFADMAVLVRKADSIDPFTRAFDDAGIPYAVTAGKGFYEGREVNDLTHLLRIVANPRDEVSLAAVLRSPLVGVSDECLLGLKQLGNLGEALTGPDAGASPVPLADLETLRQFQRDLSAWRDARDFLSPDRILIRAMDRSGYELRLPLQAREKIEKFLGLVREASSRQSLDELVDELAHLRGLDPREQDSQSETDEDVVRIMTIHAAKGLEFPVVFLPALQAGVSTSQAPVVLSPDLGLGVRWRNPVNGKSIKDDLYQTIVDEMRARESGESNRLLYVAMTRAEEHLVLSCSGTEKTFPNWAGYLESKFGLDLHTPKEQPREQDLPAPGGATFAVRVICTNAAPPRSAGVPVAEAGATTLILPVAAPVDRHDSTVTATSVALFAFCPRRYYLARYLGWEGFRKRAVIEEDEGEVDRDGLDAGEFGTEVHKLLAGASRPGASPEAIALADRFENSELGMRALRTTRKDTEFDFLMAVEGMVLRGQIDLWFEEGGEQVIVDYKTDDVDEAEAARRAQSYAPQLQLYAIAVERITGRRPDRAYVYLLRPDLAVAIDVGAAALENARQAVRLLREAQAGLHFPLHEGAHCWKCPFFRGMCPAGDR